MKKSTFWDVTVPRAMTVYANAIFVALWVGFIAALAVNREWLDLLWNWVQMLPSLPRIAIWVFFLPVMVGLWIWESDWSSFARLMGLMGIVAWTLVAVANIPKVFRK
jgi:ABC-type proline/glycine betaine transport system permease subunit